MCYPTWIFNSAARAASDSSSFAMMNTQMNLMMETMRTNQFLFMMPNPLCSSYPIMQNYSLNLPDPKEWAKQMWDMRPDYLKNPQFFFNNMQGTNTTSGVSNSSTASRKEKDYQQITDILRKLKTEGILTEDEEDAIDEATKKSGTIEEKLEAVKEALTTVSKNPNVKDAIAKTAISDSAIQIALYEAGYNTGKGKYQLENKAHQTKSDYQTDDALATGAQAAVRGLKNFNGDKTELADTLTALGGGADGATIAKHNVLITISHLNSATNEEGGFIKLLVGSYDKCKNDETKGLVKSCIKAAHDSLMLQANSINTNNIGDLKDKYEQSISDLTKSYNALAKDEDSLKSKDKRTKYVNDFNNLYKMLRLIKAKQADNDIKDKYGKLNNTVAGIVPEDIVVSDTKALLEAENIGNVEDVDLSGVSGKSAGGTVKQNTQTSSNPAKAKADNLKSGYLSSETSIGTDVYSTKNDYTTSTPKTYYVVQDEKLVELKGAVRYMNGKFQMKDGSKKTLSELIEANKNNADVSEQSIKDSVNFKKKIADYINTSEKLTEEDPKGSNGEAILADQSGTRTFVIIGNDLYEIDGCDVDDLESASSIVFDNGKAKVGSVTKDLKKITNWDVINNL